MSKQLLQVLEDAKKFGFLGPGAVTDHVSHSGRFIEAAGSISGDGIDLGSGGGVPGLCLALARQDVSWTLLDASARRCEFLVSAIAELGLTNARVEMGRAEDLARDTSLRHRFEVATARGFGPPAVVAECATGFLKTGGVLVVSEPPGNVERWPVEKVAELGLVPSEHQVAGVMVLNQASLCDERWPRRTGIPRKRPLF